MEQKKFKSWTIRQIGCEIEKEENRKIIQRQTEQLNLNQDYENRKYVKKKIAEHMEKGMSQEEAVDLIMQEDIVSQFEYLKKNGLDIRQCFLNWTNKLRNEKSSSLNKKGEER